VRRDGFGLDLLLSHRHFSGRPESGGTFDSSTLTLNELDSTPEKTRWHWKAVRSRTALCETGQFAQLRFGDRAGKAAKTASTLSPMDRRRSKQLQRIETLNACSSAFRNRRSDLQRIHGDSHKDLRLVAKMLWIEVQV